jgi:hypothetical protein
LLLSEILKKNTDMYAVLYDARSVICGAAPLSDAHGITGRWDIIVGDFF